MNENNQQKITPFIWFKNETGEATNRAMQSIFKLNIIIIADLLIVFNGCKY